mmetsp:Transcript_6843/g.12407  ORF Transcript_6843/g.12407 Transcript_6843/m.12407 type:complete len:121 (-) Transcript_6843:501-863(-)
MKRGERPFKILDNATPTEVPLKKQYIESRSKASPMRNFLISLNLDGLYDVLKDNQVSFQDLPLLTKEDLVDLQVPIGPRNRLLKAIQTVDFDKFDSRASEYEESMEGTGRFGTKDEVGPM